MAPARVTGYLVERHSGEQPDGGRKGAPPAKGGPPKGAPLKGGSPEGGWHADNINEVA